MTLRKSYTMMNSRNNKMLFLTENNEFFEDSDENKFEYTAIFEEYQKLIEGILFEKISEKYEHFDIELFMEKLNEEDEHGQFKE